MQSKTSFFNTTLFRKNLTTYWPLFIVYTLYWVLLIPVTQFVIFFGRTDMSEKAPLYRLNRVWDTFELAGEGGMVIFTCGMGLLFAMALFLYLHNARSVGMMHSFPIARKTLYFTQYATGVIVFVGIHVLTAGLSLAVQAAAGCLDLRITGLWFLITTCSMLFFFSFAVFCTMFTGQILAVPVYYGILNGVVLGINMMMNLLVSAFLYGMDRTGDLSTFADWCTPVGHLIERVGLVTKWDEAREYVISCTVEGVHIAVIYGVAGLVFALWGFWVYSKRPSETAGDAVAIYWAKPIFRGGVAICAGLSLGQAFYYVFWVEFLGASMFGVLVCMVALGLVGTVVAEMILRKSFRVLRQSVPTMVVSTAVLVGMGLCVQFDILGVESTIPARSEVASVYFRLSGSYGYNQWTSDTEVVDRLVRLHQTAIDQKDTQERLERESQGVQDENLHDVWFTVEYYNHDEERFLERDYSLYYTADDLADPNSLASQLQALCTTPAVTEYDILGDRDEISRILGGELRYLNLETGDREELYFTPEDAQVIYDAVVRDMDAGHFGVYSLWYDEGYENGYDNSLRLEITRTGKQKYADTLFVDFTKANTHLLTALEDLGYGAYLQLDKEIDQWEKDYANQVYMDK